MYKVSRCASLSASASTTSLSHHLLLRCRCVASVPSLPFASCRFVSSTNNTNNSCEAPPDLATLKKQLLFDQSSTTSTDLEDELTWESEGLTLFSPHATDEDKMRAQKTREFVRLLLTTDDEQEWRDMLTAAVRLWTWKPHHMDAVLRGVAHPPPGAASPPETGRRTKRLSTPSLRLQRAAHVMQLWWDIVAEMKAEGVVLDGADGDGGAEVRVDTDSTDLVRPPEAQVYQVLLQLLRGAQTLHGHDGTAQLEKDVSSAIQQPKGDAPLASSHEELRACATYAQVWHFLAWMEQHNYHLLSTAILPDLEAAVDAEDSPQDERLSGSDPSASATRYALASRRVNRLEYLKGEKNLIRQRERDERQQSLDAETSASRSGSRRRVDQPRVDPAL